VRARGAAAVLAAAAVAATGCGGGSDDDARAARATVERYLAALARGDAAGACAEFSPRSRDELAHVGAQLRVKQPSCEATLARAFASPSGPAMRRLGRLRVTGVTVRGRHAVAVVSGGGQPVALVRVGDAWRIDSAPRGEGD